MNSLILRGDLYQEGSSRFLFNIEEKRLTLANRESILTRTQIEITCDDST